MKISTTDFNFINNTLRNAEIHPSLMEFMPKVAEAISQLSTQIQVFHDKMMEKHQGTVDSNNILTLGEEDCNKEAYSKDIADGMEVENTSEIQSLREYITLFLDGVGKGTINVKMNPEAYIVAKHLIDSLTLHE
jgi:hypothetical protein